MVIRTVEKLTLLNNVVIRKSKVLGRWLSWKDLDMSYIEDWVEKVKFLDTGVETLFPEHFFPTPFYLFRGESKKWDNPISSNLFRRKKLNQKEELNYYRDCFNRIYSPEKAFLSDLNLRFLCYLQHNGFKTRLVDLTDSLEVALFFAANNHQQGNGYVFKLFGYDLLSIGQDLDFANISSIFFNKDFPDFKHHLLEGGNPHFFYRDTNPYNIKLRRQRGWHLFQADHYTVSNSFVFRYPVTPDDKKMILKELEREGFSEEYLFPSIRKIADSMNGEI